MVEWLLWRRASCVEVVEQSDHVRHRQLAIVVDVGALWARGLVAVSEDVVEQGERVGDVHSPVRVRIATTKRYSFVDSCRGGCAREVLEILVEV